MRHLLRRASLCAALLSSAAHAQTALAGTPNTDIFVSRITFRDGVLTVQPPLNITNRVGYDNQPSFDASGRTIFYTRRAPNALLRDSVRDVQTDIWRTAPDGTGQRPVAETAESEYSAQVTDDGTAVTVVRVERDSAQHLWRLPLTARGSAARLVGAVKPVGYYAWVGSTVAMYVLGTPATLQVVDTSSGRRDTIARDVGRGVRRVPGTSQISFVQRAASGPWALRELDLSTRRVTPLVPIDAGSEEYTWLDANTALIARGTQLLTWRRGDRDWAVAADLRDAPLTNITRLALDPARTQLAFVALPTGQTAR
jgi:hypothetical protein